MTKRTLILATLLVGAAYSWAGSLPALAGAEPETAPISSNIPVVDNIKLQIETKSNILKGKSNYDNLTHSLNINSGIYDVDTVQKVNVLLDNFKASNFKEKSGVLSSSSKGLNLKNILAVNKKTEETPAKTQEENPPKYVIYDIFEDDSRIYYDDNGKLVKFVDPEKEWTLKDFEKEDLQDYLDRKLAKEGFYSSFETEYAGQNVKVYYNKNQQIMAVQVIGDEEIYGSSIFQGTDQEYFQTQLNNYLNPKEELDRE